MLFDTQQMNDFRFKMTFRKFDRYWNGNDAVRSMIASCCWDVHTIHSFNCNIILYIVGRWWRIIQPVKTVSATSSAVKMLHCVSYGNMFICIKSTFPISVEEYSSLALSTVFHDDLHQNIAERPQLHGIHIVYLFYCINSNAAEPFFNNNNNLKT